MFFNPPLSNHVREIETRNQNSLQKNSANADLGLPKSSLRSAQAVLELKTRERERERERERWVKIGTANKITSFAVVSYFLEENTQLASTNVESTDHADFDHNMAAYFTRPAHDWRHSLLQNLPWVEPVLRETAMPLRNLSSLNWIKLGIFLSGKVINKTVSLYPDSFELNKKLNFNIKKKKRKERKQKHAIKQLVVTAQWVRSLLVYVKEEISVGEKFCTFPSKTFRLEFNFVLSEWLKEEKTRRDDRKVCKPRGRKFGMEINSVLFSIFLESYETKFPTKISSFTVTTLLNNKLEPIPAVTAPYGSSELNTFPENVVIFLLKSSFIICW